MLVVVVVLVVVESSSSDSEDSDVVASTYLLARLVRFFCLSEDMMGEIEVS